MGHKKQSKAADRKAKAAGRERQPFSPPSSTDPRGGSAPIAPVTPEMMNHAAHAAAERADAVAHDAPEPVRPATGPVAHDGPEAAQDAHRDAPDAEPDPAVAHARTAAAGPIDGISRYNAKILEIAAANLSAAGELVSALLEATSVSEAAAINAEHLRRRLDAMTTQGRDLVRLAQEVAFDAMRPSGDDRRDP